MRSRYGSSATATPVTNSSLRSASTTRTTWPRSSPRSLAMSSTRSWPPSSHASTTCSRMGRSRSFQLGVTMSCPISLEMFGYPCEVARPSGCPKPLDVGPTRRWHGGRARPRRSSARRSRCRDESVRGHRTPNRQRAVVRMSVGVCSVGLGGVIRASRRCRDREQAGGSRAGIDRSVDVASGNGVSLDQGLA